MKAKAWTATTLYIKMLTLWIVLIGLSGCCTIDKTVFPEQRTFQSDKTTG